MSNDPASLGRRIRAIWTSDPGGAAVDLLRVGVGVIWAINLVFILAPQNDFFPTFQDSALGYGPSTLGGPGVAQFVADHSTLFAACFAGVTAYLAVAFLLGATTRFACGVGLVFSVGLLLTQFGSTFFLPGGTDVGPHPLYMLIYIVLFLGHAGRYFAVDHWMWARGHARFPRLSRWLASPRS